MKHENELVIKKLIILRNRTPPDQNGRIFFLKKLFKNKYEQIFSVLFNQNGINVKSLVTSDFLQYTNKR